MTKKADFNAEEWSTVVEGPILAGLRVITASRGGTIRESLAMGQVYAEARKQHGESELLDEITAAKPETDRTRYHSPEELKEGSVKNIREAVELLKTKAAPEEVDEYKKFIVGLANRVAEARKEGFMGLSGERVSDDERSAIAEVEAALG
jgi:hypothetical protein